MQRRLVAAPVILFVLIEVLAVVRAFAFAQLAPPVFTQRVEIFGAGVIHYFRRSIGLVALVSVSDDYRMPMPERIFVQVNIFVRYAFAQSFLDCISDRRT